MFKLLVILCTFQTNAMVCKAELVAKGYPSMEVCEKSGRTVKEKVEEVEPNLRIFYKCEAEA